MYSLVYHSSRGYVLNYVVIRGCYDSYIHAIPPQLHPNTGFQSARKQHWQGVPNRSRAAKIGGEETKLRSWPWNFYDILGWIQLEYDHSYFSKHEHMTHGQNV